VNEAKGAKMNHDTSGMKLVDRALFWALKA